MADYEFFIIVSVVTLMFLDYYLTLKGAFLYKRGFSNYIKLDNYELNPNFQKAISESKYNLRHLLLVIATAILISLIFKLNDMVISAIISGMLLTTFVYINACHLQNILIFKAVEKSPELIKGQIKQTYDFSLKSFRTRLLTVTFPLLLIFLFRPDPFVFGALLGIIILFFVGKRKII